jgi:hypothetical protein
MQPRRQHTFVALLALGGAAWLATGCGDATPLGKLGETAERLAPSVTPTPTPQPSATPAATPPSANRLLLAGDVNFEDADPEVVLLLAGDRLDIEIRHREDGSAAPDSTLHLLQVPKEPGTYTLHPPTTPPVPGRLAAYLTSRTERVGSMKDFTAAVNGKLTLHEESPGVLLGTFQLAAQEAPKPPPPVVAGMPTPSPLLGTVPPPPPAQVQASGSFLALLSAARQPEPEPVQAIVLPTATPAPTATAAATSG